MHVQKIIIGTRGSKLSLAQTAIVADQLQRLLPDAHIEIKTITTHGDTDMSPVPLDSVGKGWFTKELDKALLSGKIDLAVHSLKDLPEELPHGLIIAALPKREDAREALVSVNGLPLDTLQKGAIIGTDSARRKAQILHIRSDLVVQSVRGNVNRRLEKLDNGEYDALFLAVAGLKRLGLADRITEYFDEDVIVPSPGQGALAIVTKEENPLVYHLKKLTDKPTAMAVQAERAFSHAMGGGCTMPIGAYAEIVGKKLRLIGVVGSLDGTHLEKDFAEGELTKPVALGKILATRLLKKCKPWYIV